jgi:MFS family permease
MKKQTSPWIALLIMLSAPLLSVIDVFIVNIAIPSIKAGLHADDAQTQLVIASYLLGYAAFLITGGRFGDQYGRKRVFLWGMAMFTLTSCLCGLSQAPWQLNLARFLQGISASFMVPQTISYIQVLFPEHKDRTKAVGWFGITLGLASITGQFLGGFFSYFHFYVPGWRLIFFINLPIGIVALWAANRYIEETAQDRSKKFDFSGVLLLTFALFSLIFPLIQGREYNFPVWCFLLLVLGFLMFYLFIKDQRQKLHRAASPLINVKLFSFKDFNIGLLGVICLFMAHNSFLLISTILFQDGMLINPFATGNMFVVSGIGMMISSLTSIRLIARFGKIVVQLGIVVMIGSLAMQIFCFNQHISSFPVICTVLFLYGLGLGAVLPSLLKSNLKKRTAGICRGCLRVVFNHSTNRFGIRGSHHWRGVLYHFKQKPGCGKIPDGFQLEHQRRHCRADPPVPAVICFTGKEEQRDSS